MQEVSKKSINGGSQVSGGFIFDQMDRFAHDYLCNEYGKDKFYFTKDAKIVFSKQICDWNDVELYKAMTIKRMTCPTLETIEYVVGVTALSKSMKDTYAHATFTFVEKDHAYCDTKGE